MTTVLACGMGVNTTAVIAVAAQSHHATRCTLEHLAFARVPSPPNTRRLPAEYVVEEAEATA